MEQLRTFFDTLSRWSLVGLAALLPVFFLPGNFVTIPQGKMVLISVLVGIAVLFWFISSVLEGGTRIPKHAVLFVSTLLPFAYVVSTAIAGWPSSSVVSGLAEQDTVVTIVLLFITLVITALVLQQQPSASISVLRAAVVGIFALVLLSAARLFVPSLTFGGAFANQTTAAVGGWHDLGIILGLAVVLCGALLRTRIAGSGIWRIIFAATAVLSFVFLVIVSMQDVWFVLAGVSGLFGVYAWFATGSIEGVTSSMRAARAALWILVALSAFLLGWFNTTIHDSLPTVAQVTAVEVRPSWEGTLSVGQSSLSDSRALLFGTGPNSFARSWALYKPQGVNATLFWNFDFNTGVGVVPTSFVTIGALGVAAWILLALAFLWSVGRALLATRLFDATQTTVFSLTCAILLLFAFHVMYSPGIAVSALLFLLLGVFVALPISDSPRSMITLRFNFETVGRFLSMIMGGVAVLLVLLASAISVLALSSDVLVNRSIIAYNQNGNVMQSTGLVRQALDIWSSNDRAHRAAVELGILELAQLARSAQTDTAAQEQLQTTLQQTIDHGLAAVSIDRVDYQNWLTLAQLYQELAGVGIEGAYEQARTAYNSAVTENPTNPLPLFRLGQLESARGNRTEATKQLEAALALKPDFAPAHFLLSQLLAQENRVQDAVASAVAVVQLVPEDALGWYNLGVILYIGGSYNEAGAAFAQAVTLQADYSNALFMLALTYNQVEQPDQAVAALARVFELNPSDQTVPAMIANIRAGKDPFDGLTSAQ